MKLQKLFEKFEENIVRTDLIFAGRAAGEGTTATCESNHFSDTAADPNTFQQCETQCTPDPDECDAIAIARR